MKDTPATTTTTNFTQPQSAQLESRAGYGLRSRALSLQHATVDTLRMRQPTGTTTDGNRDSKHNRINTTDWERDGRCSRRSRREGGARVPGPSTHRHRTTKRPAPAQLRGSRGRALHGPISGSRMTMSCSCKRPVNRGRWRPRPIGAAGARGVVAAGRASVPPDAMIHAS